MTHGYTRDHPQVWVKTVDESASICGYDVQSWESRRHRYLLVATLGLLLPGAGYFQVPPQASGRVPR
jgi:hypothetical protein